MQENRLQCMGLQLSQLGSDPGPLLGSTHGSAILNCIEQLLASFSAKISTPVDLNLELVDSKLTKLLKRVRILRNATLPAIQLPPEILGAIFRMIQDPLMEPHPTRGSMEHRVQFPHTWMRVRLVCHYWHDIANSCPFLWTNILFDATEGPAMQERHTHLCRLFLRNSAQCQLNTYLKMSDSPEHDPLLAEVFSQLLRIRELQLFGKFPLSQNIRQLLLDSSAPNLRVLVVSLPFTNDVDSDRLSLPGLLSGGIPLLRFLAIHDFTDCSRSNFRNLKQLHFNGQVYPTINHLQRLLDILDGNSTLEDLMFSGFCAKTRLWNLKLLRRSRLPRLKRLAFVSHSGDNEYQEFDLIRAIILCLDLPSKLSLAVHGMFECTDLQGLIPWIELFTLYSVDRARFSIYPNAGDPCCSAWVAGASSAIYIGKVELDGEDGHSPFARGFGTVVNAVQELWVDGRGFLDGRDCRELLSYASYLIKLCLNDMWTSLEWLRALRNCRFPPTCQVPCTLLRELHIFAPFCVVLHEMHECLQVRKDHGFPLETLYIYWPLEVRLDFFNESEAKILLQPLVGQLECINTDCPPSMEYPPICTAQSDGRWNWPTWSDHWRHPIDFN